MDIFITKNENFQKRFGKFQKNNVMKIAISPFPILLIWEY